jgi:hypothetical protein
MNDLSLLFLAPEIFHHLDSYTPAICFVYLQGTNRAAAVGRSGQIYELHLREIVVKSQIECPGSKTDLTLEKT